MFYLSFRRERSFGYGGRGRRRDIEPEKGFFLLKYYKKQKNSPNTIQQKVFFSYVTFVLEKKKIIGSWLTTLLYI